MSMPPDDSPCGRALRYSQMMTDFCCVSWPPQPETLVPAWLLTAEGQAWWQAWLCGDLERCLQIFEDVGTRTTQEIFATMFADLVPPAAEEKTDG